mgnify:FL=1
MFGSIFSFPHPVNEYAARVVAGCVLLLSILLAFTMSLPVAVFLFYGFLARVLAGPTLSPIGQIATRLVVPLIIKRDKPVAGPPKRFAQAVGLMVSGLALIFILTEQSDISRILYIVLAVFAAAESIVGFCAGCRMFALLMKMGLIPEDVCEACNNLNFTQS